MRSRILLLMAGSLVLIAPACRVLETATPEPGVLDTAVAQTVQVRLTSEAAARTPTMQVTDTSQPTDTPEPTNTQTPQPTSTPEPTDTLAPTTSPATDTPTVVPSTAPASATPTPVPTTVETPTDIPTEQPTVPATPTCSLAVAPQFSSRLEAHPDILLQLGCPIEPGRETWAAEQRFQSGGMLWQQDIDVIHIVYGNGIYQFVSDQWEEGDPEYLCPQQGPPPAGLVMPKRGFGWHWCNTPGARAGLGWALEEEKGYQAMWQNFEQGHVLPNRQGVLFIFHDDGTWDTIG